MSFLSDEERAALQALPNGRNRSRRAEALVNPASGLANDYLNLFNEIVMLVEQLPFMAELFEDIERWRPVSYKDYFERSILPGRLSALENYDKLDPRFRREFEALVEELDRRATGAVAAVRRQYKAGGDENPELAPVCEKAGAKIREVLDQATMLVNHGTLVPAGDIVQHRTDALMSRIAAPFP